jgi:hypothetical protein
MSIPNPFLTKHHRAQALFVQSLDHHRFMLTAIQFDLRVQAIDVAEVGEGAVLVGGP